MLRMADDKNTTEFSFSFVTNKGKKITVKCAVLRQSHNPPLLSRWPMLEWCVAAAVMVQASQIVLSVCLALSSNGGGDEAICSVEKNQFSSSKDETTKQDIDLEIKCFLKTSHIL